MSAMGDKQVSFPIHSAISEVSRRSVEPYIDEVVYRAGYTTFAVHSSFAGKHQLSELLYSAILKKLNHTGGKTA